MSALLTTKLSPRLPPTGEHVLYQKSGPFTVVVGRRDCRRELIPGEPVHDASHSFWDLSKGSSRAPQPNIMLVGMGCSF